MNPNGYLIEAPLESVRKPGPRPWVAEIGSTLRAYQKATLGPRAQRTAAGWPGPVEYPTPWPEAEEE